MREENNIKNRVGEVRTMSCGEEAEIIEYNGVRDITVKFLKTGELVKSEYGQFKKGTVKSHFTPTAYGVGIIGLEKTKEKNGEAIKSYKTWNRMLERYYSKIYQQKRLTYKDCTVCDEWIYYPNFKIWYEENYYEIEGQKTCLDKDILVKGNKIYSPDTCIFVPERINTLFTKRDANRGDLPIGVSWHKKSEKYETRCSIFEMGNNKTKKKYLGLHNTPEEAFNVYKQFKEKYIKQVADYYKEQIPKKLHDAMYSYKVHIDD